MQTPKVLAKRAKFVCKRQSTLLSAASSMLVKPTPVTKKN